jgi:uncharacterized protein YggE
MGLSIIDPEGRHMRARTVVLAGLVLTLLTASLVPAHAAAVATDTVTVSATKTVDVEPDLGRVSLGVRVVGDTAAEATDKLAKTATAVVDALKAAGFTAAELSTYGVSLSRVCLSDCRDPHPRDNFHPTPVFGYAGSEGVLIETQRLDKLSEAVDAGVSGGANSIRNVSFDVKDKDAAVLKALKQAMDFANAKAQVLAEEGGRVLGPAIIIIEGRSSAPRAAGVLGSRLGVPPGSSGASAGVPFPIEPPTLSASAHVEVTYQLN